MKFIVYPPKTKAYKGWCPTVCETMADVAKAMYEHYRSPKCKVEVVNS